MLMSLALFSCASSNPDAVPVTHMGVKAVGDTNSIPVSRGDTVYIMAQRLGVDLRALIDSNNLAPPYDLRPGQRLRIPTPPVTRVQEGDTLYSIARAYNADQAELVRLNNLKPPYNLAYGQQIKLPSVPVSSSAIVTTAQNDAPVLVDEPVYEMGQISTTSASVDTPQNKQDDNNKAAAVIASAPAIVMPSIPSASVPSPVKKDETLAMRKAPATPQPTAKKTTLAGPAPSFSWPVNGSVLSDFGPKAGGRHNDGLNIGAPLGTPVRAAAAGEVVYTGDKVAGFGNLILIRHNGGYATAYAHIQKPLVARGEQISAGQTSASIGKTGNVSTPQVQFEIRKGTRPVNPKTYLP